MIKTKICALISVAVIVVAALSSSKKDTTQQVYADQIIAMSGLDCIGGGRLHADSLSGKMIILNFWASYDATSRINNYELVKLSEEYSDKYFHQGEGLEVVSISLDKFKSPLKKAISTDGTNNFYHICDYKGLESELAKSFDVNRPVNLLIDANGTIVARDFNVSTLRSALSMLACEGDKY